MAGVNRDFDVCIVCAKAEEAQAVVEEFASRCRVLFKQDFIKSDNNYKYAYDYAEIRNQDKEVLAVFVTSLSHQGPVKTAAFVTFLLQELHPRFIAMAGYCAGDKKELNLGDLVVAESAYHYEEGKVKKGEDGQLQHVPLIRPKGPSDNIVQYINKFIVSGSWKKAVARIRLHTAINASPDSSSVKCLIGSMASGMAVRRDDPFDELQSHNHNTLALDMEAASFYEAAWSFSGIYSLVVKGVSDHANVKKNDDYHKYAAHTSATFLLSFIREYVTDAAMPRRDEKQIQSRAGPSGIFSVPYQQNLCFTGREHELKELHNMLTTTSTAALTQPQALSGLGGIGKTQMAVEYAYRYRETYRFILWARAATIDTLISDFVSFAGILQLPEKNESDQEKIVEAVKRWLESHTSWLLIFDNADDVRLIHDFLPRHGEGPVLITTRAQAVGANVACISVEPIGMMEGALLLLRRAKIVPMNATLDQAAETLGSEMVDITATFADELGQFPLALDQAGAYIEETGCNLSDYIELYKSDHDRKKILALRGNSKDYPASVATTWSLSFQKVKEVNPAAAELLYLCAFLAPDAIPEELISEGALHWTPRLKRVAVDKFELNNSIEVLLKFSLIKRQRGTRTLNIHRLVQVVIKDRMKEIVQRRWAKRTVQATNVAFPQEVVIETWSDCQRYLPQSQACAGLIQDYSLDFEEAGDLLSRTALYLKTHAFYVLAVLLYQQALHIYEQTLGPDHIDVAYGLLWLANVYYEQDRYTEAEPLYQRALSIREQALGLEHPDVAYPLNNLANLYYQQGKYTEAEPRYQRALSLLEQALGPEHPQVAHSLAGLANIYKEQGRYTEAEPRYQRALSLLEQALGPEHPDVAYPLNNLANLYNDQEKYAEAEPLYQRALSIREQALGLEHPDVAHPLNNLANLYCKQSRYAEAEPLYRRALTIWEQALGSEHSQVAYPLQGLANLCNKQGRYEEAKPLYQRALYILEQAKNETN